MVGSRWVMASEVGVSRMFVEVVGDEAYHQTMVLEEAWKWTFSGTSDDVIVRQAQGIVELRRRSVEEV
jgi:hypothetical protein